MPENSQNYGGVLKELGYGIQEDCKIDCIKVMIQGSRGFKPIYFGITMGDTPKDVEATFEDFLYANDGAISKTEIMPTAKQNRLEIAIHTADENQDNLYNSFIAINDKYKRGVNPPAKKFL